MEFEHKGRRASDRRRQLALLELSLPQLVWCDEKAEKWTEFGVRDQGSRRKYLNSLRYPSIFITQCKIRRGKPLCRGPLQPCRLTDSQTPATAIISRYAHALHMRRAVKIRDSL